MGWGGDLSVFIVHWVHTDLKTRFIYNNPNGIIPMHLHIHVLIIVCGYCNSLDHNPSLFNLSNFQWSIYMYVDIYKCTQNVAALNAENK